jgi:hypothetical protein
MSKLVLRDVPNLEPAPPYRGRGQVPAFRRAVEAISAANPGVFDVTEVYATAAGYVGFYVVGPKDHCGLDADEQRECLESALFYVGWEATFWDSGEPTGHYAGPSWREYNAEESDKLIRADAVNESLRQKARDVISANSPGESCFYSFAEFATRGPDITISVKDFLRLIANAETSNNGETA